MTKSVHREPSQRQLRVGEEIRHVLAWLMERGDLRDPGLVHVHVTVTEVRVSPDMRNATVFVTPLEGGDVQEMLAALARARPFLRRYVAGRVRLKYVPDLTFEQDLSFDHASRIDALLRDPRVARDLESDSDADAGGPDQGSDGDETTHGA